jgi:HEAT repeat protein
MAGSSVKQLTHALDQISRNEELLESAQGKQDLLTCLQSKHAAVLIRAANLIAEHQLQGFNDALRNAYQHLAGRQNRRDPNTAAKVALLTALEAIEDTDQTLFATAALETLPEAFRGGLRDISAGIRVRGLLGLARLGHPELLMILATCITDHDANVRLTAARVLAHRGEQAGAALLVMRLETGETIPEVIMECIHGLLTIEPTFAIRVIKKALEDTNPHRREPTLHALGTARSAVAVQLLSEELANCSDLEDRQLVIEALGLSLRPEARSLLLELVASDSSSEAWAALDALAIHKYDKRLMDQLMERASHSPELVRRVRELIPKELE